MGRAPDLGALSFRLPFPVQTATFTNISLTTCIFDFTVSQQAQDLFRPHLHWTMGNKRPQALLHVFPEEYPTDADLTMAWPLFPPQPEGIAAGRTARHPLWLHTGPGTGCGKSGHQACLCLHLPVCKTGIRTAPAWRVRSCMRSSL